MGVAGLPWRARVTGWGAVIPDDGSPMLDWWVAAEDRWHTPSREPSLRQRLVDGMPVVETSVRVPGGDVVQTSFAVAGHGGLLVMQLDNRSPAAVAVALSRRDLLASRPPAQVPPQGGDAPADALVIPIGHRASARVGLPFDARDGGRLPDDLATPAQVAHGWLVQTGAGVDLRLPEGGPTVPLATVRAALLLDGPGNALDGARFLVGVCELGRLGVDPEPWLDDVVIAAEALTGHARRARRVSWADDAGLAATEETLRRAAHGRGALDVAAARRRLPAAEPTAIEPPDGLLGLAWAQRRMLVADRSTIDLFPAPFPPAWMGRSAEAYGVPVGDCLVGVAVRWHGEHPALLWEVAGPPMELRCSGLDPGWSTTRASGEVLLRSWSGR